jgi:hypothetical protein
MNDKEKIEDMVELLEGNCINECNIAEALFRFKLDHPSMNKYCIMSYLDDALQKIRRKAQEQFMVKGSGYR